MHLKDMKSFAQLIKFDNVWVYLVVALLNTLILFMVSYKFFQTMQQCGYDSYGVFVLGGIGGFFILEIAA